MEVHARGLHAAQDRFAVLIRDECLISGLQKVRANDPAVQFHFPLLQPVSRRARREEKIRDLLALEAHVLRVGGDKDSKRFQARVFNLILEVGSDLDFGLADHSMLKAGDLDPRLDLFDGQREVRRRLQDAEGQHALLADAGFLRVQLSNAIARHDLQAQSLFRHDEQRAALFTGLANDQLRCGPEISGFRARP